MNLPRMTAKVSVDDEAWAQFMAALPQRHLLDPVQLLDSATGEPYFPHEPESSTARFRELYDRVAALMQPLPMTDEDWADTEA